MDIGELKALYTKIVYQDSLDLDDDGARYILQDLIGDEINKMRKECKWCKENIYKYFGTNWYDFTAEHTGVTPKAKFCPNCGRKLDGTEDEG